MAYRARSSTALLGAEWLVRFGEHDFQQTQQCRHLLSERIASLFILGGRWQVEGVQVLSGATGQAHHLSAHGAAQRAVLVLRIDHQEVDADQEVAEGHELGEVALARARGGEDDGVGVLQAGVERVEEDRRVVVVGDPVEDAALHGERARRERERRGQRAGVQVAVQHEAILPLRQTGAEAAVLLQDRDPCMRQHAVQDSLDSTCEVVERRQGLGAQQQIEADREDLLLAPLERVPQSLGVLVGDLALRVGQPPAARVEEAG